MDQQIDFTKSADGTTIAYAVAGSGPPLVRAATWLTGVEHDADHPAWRHWWREFTRENTFVRYDHRGYGASSRDITDASLRARVSDLEAVVDTLDLQRFDLLGHFHGAPVSLAYAASHPERVRRLILYNPFIPATNTEWQYFTGGKPSQDLVATSWDHPRTRRVFATSNMPAASTEVIDAMVGLLGETSSASDLVTFMSSIHQSEVNDSIPLIQAPTLVIQSSWDVMSGPNESKRLAAKLPNGVSATVESRNNILQADEPGWGQFVREFRSFCSAQESEISERTSEQAANNLSPREAQILSLIANGKKDLSIAAVLDISVRTVRNHVKSILEKTGTENRAHAVAWLARKGLLDRPLH